MTLHEADQMLGNQGFGMIDEARAIINWMRQTYQ